ncbi:asparaginase [Occultella kanbiaonis]|uniref:asparaginase n=1 Tax=Occultella kanbiaonis TaxID=2675754 RepID=UPI001E520CDE|nr:asparaginase [Occultella kanbiaonis]
MVKPPPRLARPAPGEPLAWVIRGTLVESVHTGHLVALGADGAAVRTLGEPEQEIYPRSAIKPVQALAMLRAGLEVSNEQLALVCASHYGEPRHLDVAATILAGAGLSEADLRTPPSLPWHEPSAAAWIAAGRPPSALAHNCSGKHAGMLATCRAAGWPTEGYLDPAHPLQQSIAATITELTGVEPAHLAVDGCGAPQFSTTVVGLARAFARIAAAETGPEARVRAAMTAHPWLVGGTGRDVTEAMTSEPGLVAKDGADGVYAAAMPDGRALAFKVSDGGGRARPVILAAALHELGVEGFWSWGRVPVLGGGAPAGAIRAAFGAEAPPGLG